MTKAEIEEKIENRIEHAARQSQPELAKADTQAALALSILHLSKTMENRR